jgi:plasmid maintenance system antidote protein VapI
MSDERGDHDHVVRALDALVEAVERNSGDERQLVRKLGGLREARASGTPVAHALGQERPPGTMELLGRVLSRLMEASGATRRALARAMRAEGTSIPGIARLFGVTHQRVSNILNQPAVTPSAVAEHVPSSYGEAGELD